ncbi:MULTISPECIES: DeoR/GlpR family DNA-binding transcription regulator [Aerococcus]|uniref:DeoR/GlpR family DNA-binding transcription regulator n=1 Tax=Aerococcus TaxID=1375 RepID=UPI0018A75413|nr:MULTISPECIES: DeoR/GlpR family DNA-binding transcription regulator [Aerococcus]MCY3036044.1 DeoR/GlpR family DNA-binding transcription regulator [Aerococcus sp. Group 2]MCY3039139.1 DeoR/GlpR family DNA-binding transcription regulator [Aerococcus sp. Group 2]MCY3040715.1 DeoR/GlpR family DNA-binding transcription regulator [Aerococcus sp. Group 2]MCY3042707.1 DeoR/GlpR family DNA-binding transcription regulator [Aerococcus sp. Group 2]MDK6520852.1 DeoR/GlpR family DNA-binding transcription 
MYQEERLRVIMKELKDKGRLTAKEMTAALGVSRDTVRRDFNLLEGQGLAHRTHGGLILPKQVPVIAPYQSRSKQSTRAKRAIAQVAQKFLLKEGFYFFDVSTVVSQLAQLSEGPMTVYSHSLDNALIFSEKERVDFNLLGGKYYPKNRFFANLDTLKQLDRLYFDVAFIGAAGLKGGKISYDDQADCQLKEVVIKNSQTTVLLAGAEKFQQSGHYQAGTLEEIDYLITSQAPEAIKKIDGLEVIETDRKEEDHDESSD